MDHQFENFKNQFDISSSIKDFALIPIVSGSGFETLFKELGAHVTIPSGEKMNPSAKEILSVIENLNIEQRMTICNMSIEARARAGLIAPDEKIFKYLKGKPMSPKNENWNKAFDYWESLKTDSGAKFDKEVEINGSDISPMVTWGTSPQDVVPINGIVPDPETFNNDSEKAAARRALEYMGLQPNTPIKEITLDKVFIGSCTNSRIEDLRSVASIVKDKKVNANVNAIIVPGSFTVKLKAEQEGLDDIFKNAGFEWREAGCSMCLGMNPDILQPGERSASTSNRNVEGRQGPGGRTHLVSPEMAAAAAIAGHFVDVREWK